MDAQTDYYIDKPPDRLFKPRKNGVDKVISSLIAGHLNMGIRPIWFWLRSWTYTPSVDE